MPDGMLPWQMRWAPPPAQPENAPAAPPPWQMQWSQPADDKAPLPYGRGDHLAPLAETDQPADDKGSGVVSPGDQSTWPADQRLLAVAPQSQIGADVNSLAQNAVAGVGSNIRGVGQALAAAGQRMTQQALDVMDRIDHGEEVPPDQDVLGYGAMSAEQRAATRAEMQADLHQEQAQGPTGLTRAGQSVINYGKSQFPVAPERKGLQTSLAGMVGGFAPVVGSAAAGALVGGPVGGIAATAGALWTQSYDSTYQDAISKGATPDEADAAARANAGVQAATISLPVSHLIEAIPAPLRDGFVKTVVDFGKRGLEFAHFNALSKFAENFVARETYDPKRPLMEGVPQAAGQGMVLGTLTPMAAAAARGALHGTVGVARTLAGRGTPAASPELQQAVTDLRTAAEEARQPGAAPAPPAQPAQPEAPPAPPPQSAAAAELQAAINASQRRAEADRAAATEPPTQPPPPQPAPEPPESPPVQQAAPTTTPEPAADIQAQIAALRSPKSARDAVFVASGNEAAIPAGLPKRIQVVERPEGTLLTTNKAKADAFRGVHALGDAEMASLLGLPETKQEAVASGAPQVVQAVTPQGTVAAETLASPQGVPAAAEAVQAKAPDAEVRVVTPDQAQERRAEVGAAPAAEPEAPAAPESTQPAPSQRGPSAYMPVPKEPLRLIDFLRQRTVLQPGTPHEEVLPGGLKDEGGDIRAILGSHRARPGLINKNGQNLDDATLRAWQAGYFPEFGEQRPEINDLLDAIREDHAGRPRYSMHDDEAVLAYEQAMRHNAEIDRLAATHGVDPWGKTYQQFFDEVSRAAANPEAIEDRAGAEHDEMFDHAQQMEQEAGGDPADIGEPRSLEDLEREYQQAEAAGTVVPGEAQSGGPGPAAAGAGSVPEGGEPGVRGSGDERGAAEAEPELSGEPQGRVEPPAEPAIPESEIVEHTTKRGKVLRGVIRRDIDYAQAKALDPYTFRKNNGWFIRQASAEAAENGAAPPKVEAAANPQTAVQDVADAERRDVAARKSQADKLREQARTSRQKAEESLGRDRKENTARRARMAASAFADATQQEQIAKTMDNIADAIEQGEAVRLASVASRAQVEALEGALRQGLYERERDNPDPNWERKTSRPPDEEDIRHAKLPGLAFHSTHAKDIADALKGKKGFAQLVRWLESLPRDGGMVTPTPEQRAMLEKAAKAIPGNYAMKRVKEAFAERDRFTRMGIHNNEDLRKALTEYLDFRSGARKEDPIKKLERQLVGNKNVGMDFFPTPPSLVQNLVREADIKPGMRVLEPSAGKGDIADAMREAGAHVDVVEVSSTLRSILDAKGYAPVANDFMEFNPGEQYDRVVMNPPFSTRLDAAHVEHAYSLLKPGGRLVAITGEGVHTGTDAKAQHFREWLKQVGGSSEKLPEGSFKSAFRPTGVATRMVVIDKPEAAAPEAPVETSPQANFIRKAMNLDAARIDAYDPQAVVEKLGRHWTYKTTQGNTGPLFDTRREALEAAQKHIALKREQYRNPTAYHDPVSVLAGERLKLIERYMAAGMPEMEAGRRAEAELPDMAAGAVKEEAAAPTLSIGDEVSYESFGKPAQGIVLATKGDQALVRVGAGRHWMPVADLRPSGTQANPLGGSAGTDAVRRAAEIFPEGSPHQMVADYLLFQVTGGNPKIGNDALEILKNGSADQVWRLIDHVAEAVPPNEGGEIRREATRFAQEMVGRNVAEESQSAEENAVEIKPAASWVVVDKATGKGVLETHERKVAEKVNREKYDVVPIAEYLGDLNRRIREGSEGAASAPHPIDESLNYETTGGAFNRRRRVLQTYTLERNPRTGRILVRDDRENGQVKGSFGTVEAAMKEFEHNDARRIGASYEPRGRPAAEPAISTAAPPLAGLPEGAELVNGKGPLGRDKWGVQFNGKLIWNLEDTPEKAIAGAKAQLARQEAAGERAEQNRARDMQIAGKLRRGGDLTKEDLDYLGLFSDGRASRFDYLSPVVQRLFGIGRNKVREAMGDSLRKSVNGMNTAEHWIADPRKALANAAGYAERKGILPSKVGAAAEAPEPAAPSATPRTIRAAELSPGQKVVVLGKPHVVEGFSYNPDGSVGVRFEGSKTPQTIKPDTQLTLAPDSAPSRGQIAGDAFLASQYAARAVEAAKQRHFTMRPVDQQRVAEAFRRGMEEHGTDTPRTRYNTGADYQSAAYSDGHGRYRDDLSKHLADLTGRYAAGSGMRGAIAEAYEAGDREADSRRFAQEQAAKTTASTPAPTTDLLGRPVAEPRSAAQPAPTIRNDTRQVTMPGMEPSAVQAQAARDQVGRGALLPTAEQKPANEGLFAPKEPEQGGMFARREAEEPRVPLYSAVARAAEGLKQQRGTGEQMLAMIQRAPGVKPEEIKWLGLADWLRGQKSVTRQQVADYVRANALDVREVLHGTPIEAPDVAAMRQRFQELSDREEGRGAPLTADEQAESQRLVDELSNHPNPWLSSNAEGRYSGYTLPGGENYREMLITLPERSGGERNTANYRSSHWDEPNVLAHVRFDERTAPDGKKTLLVEEVQSDWHQAGRGIGYKTDEALPPMENFSQWAHRHGLTDADIDRIWKRQETPSEQDVRVWDAWEAERDAVLDAHARQANGVPDAPFKTTWPALVMKRIIKWAVDNGFDRVAWVPGDAQAERYDLSKQISRILYNPDDKILGAYDHTGNAVYRERTEPDKIADVVGKEAAERLLATPRNAKGYHILSGLDLKVGGEGMRAFYDKILPNEVQKIVGKYGAKVGRGSVLATKEHLVGEDEGGGSDPDMDAWLKTQTKAIPVHSFDITPAMRKAVESEGLPLFARRPTPTPESPPIDEASRTRIAEAAARVLRSAGLPPQVGLRLLDRLTDTAGNPADAHYAHALVTLALDTPPERIPAKLWHETIHAALDPKIGLLSEAERNTLLAAGDRWLRQGDHRAVLERMGYGPAEMREEAAARMGEDALARGMQPPKPYYHVLNFVRGMGQALRGEGFRTADDVFDAIMGGERQAPALDASGLPAATVNQAIGDLQRFATRPTPGPIATTTDLTTRLQDIPRVGTALASGAQRFLDYSHNLQMKATPMALGTVESRAIAKDYANTARLARDEGARIMKWLGDNFTPDQLRQMWERADAEGVAQQTGADPTGIGLDQLTGRERAVVEQLQETARQVFEMARAVGIHDAEGLPSYVPRMVVDIGSEGGAHVVRDIRTLALATMRLQEAVAGRTLINSIREAGKNTDSPTVSIGGAPARGGPGRPLDIRGANIRVTTPQMRHREHLTVEETEAAARRIPARDGFEWFTLPESPAFWTSRWAGEDAEGNPIFVRTPIYVRSDFEGPLRAVMSNKQGQIYRGMMNLKGRIMTSVMYGAAHLGVIVGRALPAAPNIVRTMIEGREAKENPEIRRRAIMAGLAPVGARFGIQDATGIEELPNIQPGRSWTAQLIGTIPGVFSPKAGDAVKSAIDQLGDFTHNTLLWDRVADIQFGLFTGFERYLLDHRIDPQSAARAAAHFANRYAGSLPNEAMSNNARKIANMALFSRTYRLGNLGAIKDIFTGLPRDVLSQIERDQGIQTMLRVKSLAQRKAITTIALDLAMYYVGNSLVQSGLSVLLGQNDVGDEAKGYIRRLGEQASETLADPLRALNPFRFLTHLTPMGEHEPEKQNRILIGYEKDGTGIYLRNPFGKYAEDVSDYFTQPLQTLKSMLSPFARPVYAAAANTIGFDRKLYDPFTDEPSSLFRNVANFVGLAIEGATPHAALENIRKLVTGRGGWFEAAQVVGGGLGFSVSHGYPGGPALGELARDREEHDFRVQQAMPAIRQKIRNGDVDGAEQDMTLLGIEPKLQGYYIRQVQQPHATKRQLQGLSLYGSQQQKERFQRLQRAQ